MKKIFPLELPQQSPDRVSEGIKLHIRKYLKRERRKPVPEGVDYWDFDCKFGLNQSAPYTLSVPEIILALDQAFLAKAKEVYIEILVKPVTRPKRIREEKAELDSAEELVPSRVRKERNLPKSGPPPKREPVSKSFSARPAQSRRFEKSSNASNPPFRSRVARPDSSSASVDIRTENRLLRERSAREGIRQARDSKPADTRTDARSPKFDSDRQSAEPARAPYARSRSKR